MSEIGGVSPPGGSTLQSTPKWEDRCPDEADDAVVVRISNEALRLSRENRSRIRINVEINSGKKDSVDSFLVAARNIFESLAKLLLLHFQSSS